MKIKNLFYVSLAALSLAACSKDDAPAPQGGVTFKLSSLPSATKAYSTSSVGDEAKISNAKIFIYNSEGAKIEVTPTIATDGKSASYVQNLAPGKYSVAAVANYEPDGILDVDALKDNNVDLTDNSKTNFVMFQDGGTIDIEADTQTPVNFEVKRVLSAIQLGTIGIALPPNVDPFYSNAVTKGLVSVESFQVKESHPQVKLDGTVIATGDMVSDNDLLKASFSGKTGGSSIVVTADEGSSSVTERAYVVPGSSLTIYLVLSFNGQKRNYMIELSKQQMAANVLYTLNATITGTGSTTPGVRDGSATGTVTAADWTTGVTISGGEVGN